MAPNNDGLFEGILSAEGVQRLSEEFEVPVEGWKWWKVGSERIREKLVKKVSRQRWRTSAAKWTPGAWKTLGDPEREDTT